MCSRSERRKKFGLVKDSKTCLGRSVKSEQWIQTIAVAHHNSRWIVPGQLDMEKSSKCEKSLIVNLFPLDNRLATYTMGQIFSNLWDNICTDIIETPLSTCLPSGTSRTSGPNRPMWIVMHVRLRSPRNSRSKGMFTNSFHNLFFDFIWCVKKS